MLGGPSRTALRHKLFPQYRDALARLCGPGIALADLTSVWAELLEHKQAWDLTGNGVNHPNDFGHRVYAQVLSSLLIPCRE
jgi:acyl-CoA thioesterase-1